MPSITKLSLVALTTASVALAHRGHHHAGHLHRNKRRQQYGDQTSTTAAATLPDVTSTLTETLTSTITNTVYEDLTSSTLPAAFQTPAGADATCGGTIYVTVTVTPGSLSTTSKNSTAAATSASTSSSTSPVAYVATTPALAVAPIPTTSSSAAPAPLPTTSSFTYAPTSSSPAYVAPAPPSSSSPAYVAPAPSPSPSSPAAAPAPAPSSYSAAPAPASSSYSAAPAPSSSPAPAPSTGSGLRTKRGCLYNDASDCSILGDNTISWATNWASSADGQPGSCTYVPQLWGHTSSDGSVDFTANWAANAAAAIAAGAPAVLGYNEPDVAAQANLSPAAGASLWSLVTAFTGKATIVSPAVTSTQQGTSFPGLDWLSSFQSAGATWDATAVHFYGSCSFDPSDTASYTGQLQYLQNVVSEANSRFGKPVWVTEFGCDAGASPDQIAAFFNVALPYLEQEAKVGQYAAFKADLLISGGSPNAAGSAYMSIANN